MSAEPRDSQPTAVPPPQQGPLAPPALPQPFDAAGDQRFAAIVQHSTDLVSINDWAGMVRYISPSVTRILGYAPEELIGRPSFELLHPDDLKRIMQSYAERVEQPEGPRNVVMRFRHRNGEWRTLEAMSTNMLDHPEIQGVVVNARDVTERVEQERRLKLQAAILAQINDAVVGVDAGGRVIYWNTAAACLFRVRPDEACGRPLAEICTYRILPPYDEEEVRCLLLGNMRWRGEAELFCADGRRLIGEIAASRLRDDQGEVIGLFAVIRDITERKRVEDRLRLMEAVVVNANDAVLVTEAAPLGEPGPRICYVNQAFTRLTGYSAAETIGRSPRFLQGPATGEKELAMIRRALARNEPVRVELVNYTATGRPHWIELSIAPVFDERGEAAYFLSIQRDIDARKAAERLERERRTILEQVAADWPLPAILGRIGAMVEAQSGGRGLVLAGAKGRLACHPADAVPAELGLALGRLAAAHTASGAVSDEPLHIDDVRRDRRCAAWRATLAEHGALACAAVPVSVGGGVEAFVAWFAAAPAADGAALHDVLDSASSLAALALERGQLGEMLRFQAFHDQLTGLTNRYDFHNRLSLALEQARQRGARVALLFIDLDNFKHVNDTLGHPTGDALLVKVARRLGGCLGPGAHPARWGGDEFLVLDTTIGDPIDAERKAKAVLETLSAPFDVDGHEVALTVSIGISIFPEDGEDTTTLLKHADTALYRAKAGGRNAVRRFSPDMSHQAREFIDLEPALRRAIAGGDLAAFYQPVVDLASGRVVAVEALVRWAHPLRGLLLPAAFLPLAETCGLGDQIRTQIFELACHDAAAWRAAGHPELRVSINIAAPELADECFAERAEAALRRYNLPGAAIELEITESAVLQDIERAAAILARLRAAGVRIALDDFGTGYSSLSYLGRLPLDTLKIDRSFIQALDGPLAEATWPVALVEAILALARRLNLSVVAEGVETPGQLDAVRRFGCTQVQGWIFAHAVPLSELPATIAAIERQPTV